MLRRCCSFGAFLFSLVAVVPLCLGRHPPLDEDRVSAIGWTDAHNVAFGWPLLAGNDATIVPEAEAARFLNDASNTFLCLQNLFGQTALHLAVRENNLEVINFYVNRKLCLNTGNKDGDTPLHYAAAWGREVPARLLLNAGADLEVRNADGKTPIEDARRRGEAGIIQIFDGTASALRMTDL